MPRFRLPKGYSHSPPEQDILVPGQKLYGGADLSDAYDATGAHWVLCNATGPDGVFKFRAFACPPGSSAYKERALPDVATGRGNADVQWYDGDLHYSAWQDAGFVQNVVPGFENFPSIPSLLARIVALEALISGLQAGVPGPQGPQGRDGADGSSGSGGTLRIGAQNPPIEGGEIQLASGDGGPPFVIDVYGDYIRIHHNGKVLVQWKKG